ncbi:MAG: hypothetical protein PVJ57_08645 [Phycisphaerae bacterium]|jgi:hypothetical protein
MTLSRTTLAVLVACCVAAASAGVTPIDPFTGELYEGFETIGSVGGTETPIDIFDGAGTFDDTVAHYGYIATSLYSVPTEEYIYPYNGNIMMGSVTGWAAFEFDTPVSEFGGYIGTADELDVSTVTFRDTLGAVIDTVTIDIEHPLWAWHGWHSDTPIARVEIQGHSTPGKPLVFDDMVANTIPEPGALGLLVVAGLALARRR